jgi:phosphomannomutase
VVRPSGTEPKLKCYLEVVLDAVDGVPAARLAAAARLDAVRRDLADALS